MPFWRGLPTRRRTRLYDPQSSDGRENQPASLPELPAVKQGIIGCIQKSITIPIMIIRIGREGFRRRTFSHAGSARHTSSPNHGWQAYETAITAPTA